jgi:predicted DNA binding CopG/RHH family protein
LAKVTVDLNNSKESIKNMTAQLKKVTTDAEVARKNEKDLTIAVCLDDIFTFVRFVSVVLAAVNYFI